MFGRELITLGRNRSRSMISLPYEALRMTERVAFTDSFLAWDFGGAKRCFDTDGKNSFL